MFILPKKDKRQTDRNKNSTSSKIVQTYKLMSSKKLHYTVRHEKHTKIYRL